MQDIDRSPELSFWHEQVCAYEREAKTWESRSKKIIKRFKDERGESRSNRRSKFNILWSNVQTLLPALYSGYPIPNVDKKYDDENDVNTTVAQILERAAAHYVKTDTFDDCMRQVVLDRLLPGRGQLWVRYDTDAQVTDDVIQDATYENVVVDYVHWQDFGYTVARTWQECRAVWRKVYMSRKELIARFGEEKAKNVPMDAKPLGRDSNDDQDKCTRACIYELWDKVTKKAYWFSKEMEDFLDVLDDPLKLSCFFPCPKPVFSTLANDSMIPTPDFVLYQDQADELDDLTARIESLSKALKVVGVYDASASGVQRMLTENVENTLIPVEQWAVHAEKGGLKGVVDYMPIDMVANVLIQLYQARDKIKQDIYEITGISDIIRGATKANETATAQQIKGQYATLRLNSMQKDIDRFTRECVRLVVEIVAENFSEKMLGEISGFKLLTQAQKQQVVMMQQMQQPVPQEVLSLLDKPTWEEVITVMREDAQRSFKIDVQTDSTIKAEQEAEKAARIEFLTAAGSFIREAVQVPIPELQPLLMEMLKFGVSGFKAGREIEGEFNKAAKALEQKRAQPPVEAGVSEEQKMMAEMDSKRQIEEMKLQSNERIEQMKAASNVIVGLSKGNASATPEEVMMQMGQDQSPVLQLVAQMQQQQAQNVQMLGAMLEAQKQSNSQIVEAINREKVIKRDANGRLVSVQ